MQGWGREKKGSVDAALAFAEVVRQSPENELHIVGDGPLRGQMEKILRENECIDKVVFHGYVDVEKYLEILVSCHIVLVPSCRAPDGDTEGGAPVVCIEAQAAGKPVVGTLHCDIPSIVLHGESGLLCPEHNVKELASNLLTLIRDDKLRSQMGEAGKENARKNHEIKKQAELYAEIYDSLVNS